MKPILFNTEMVQAILEGRKTVTRRNSFKFEMKDGYNPDWSGYSLGEYYTGHIDSGVCLYSRGAHDVWGVRSNVVKPKYKVGDILYVRETFGKDKNGQYHYRADFPEHDCEPYPIWHPSIHMPKEAARIFLKVTSVRVEKLQNINCPEAEKEGCTFLKEKNSKGEFLTERGVFKELWDSTIKKQDIDEYGWEANPWVWVIEFERVEVEDEDIKN